MTVERFIPTFRLVLEIGCYWRHAVDGRLLSDRLIEQTVKIGANSLQNFSQIRVHNFVSGQISPCQPGAMPEQVNRVPIERNPNDAYSKPLGWRPDDSLVQRQ